MIAFRARNRIGGPSLLARCSVLLWVATFLLPGVRDAFAHVDCAHHSAHTAAAPAPHAGHGTAAKATHGHGHAEHTGHEADPDGSHTPCTCLGACQAVGVTVLPAAAVAELTVPAATLGPASVLPTAELLPSRPSYTLPYAIAPPRA